MGKWRAYTPEEREARRIADKALRESAQTLLDDPARLTDMNDYMASRVAPRIAGYSLRNQALLYTQAEARGITVTDVDSVQGWRRQGRRVITGSRGLRIVAPKGRMDPEQAPPDDSTDAAPAAATDRDVELRFRMVAVFDISQTVDMSDVPEPEPGAGDVAPATAGGARDA